MKLKHFGFFLVLFFGVFSQANAAILLEPVVGYNISSKLDIGSIGGVSAQNYTGRGMSYGGRLGYQNLGFQLGIDYLKSSIDYDDNDFKSNVDTSEWAGFIGFKFPILLKVYAGYVFSGMGEADANDGAGGKIDWEVSGGTGPKVGVGWTLFPFLDFNLEYRRVTYDEYKRGGVEQTNEVSYNAWMLSASLPLNL